MAQRAQHLRWQERLALTQPQLAAREPMLALRRQLAELMLVGGECAHVCSVVHALVHASLRLLVLVLLVRCW